MEGSSGEGTSYDLVEAQGRAWLEDVPCQVWDSQDLPQVPRPRPAARARWNLNMNIAYLSVPR